MSFLHNTILLIFTIVNLKVFADDSVPKSFYRNFIVPNVIPEAPDRLVRVIYGNTEVYLGNKLSITQVAVQPKVTYEAESGSLYTLVMIDPDAPSRFAPVIAQFKHWLIINIPGNNIGRGQTLNFYLLPTPPPGSGPHRYIFLIYKQDGYLCIDPFQRMKIALTRILFSIVDFAKMYNLRDPVAGNFYFAQIGVTGLIQGGL